mmetsp:Transcript_23150/g.64311  ORF Transcript_23150/g.64311 Transcript_23150/m.64311 type:complete len:257 (+) Transcript_23150:775-1545(+)
MDLLHHRLARESIRQGRHLLWAQLWPPRLAGRRNGGKVLLNQWSGLLQIDVSSHADCELAGVHVAAVEVLTRNLWINLVKLLHGEGREVVALPVVDEAHSVRKGVHRVADLSGNGLASHAHHRLQLRAHRLNPAGEQIMHELQRGLQVVGRLVAAEGPPEGALSGLELHPLPRQDVGSHRRGVAEDAKLVGHKRCKVCAAEVCLVDLCQSASGKPGHQDLVLKQLGVLAAAAHTVGQVDLCGAEEGVLLTGHHLAR